MTEGINASSNINRRAPLAAAPDYTLAACAPATAGAGAGRRRGLPGPVRASRQGEYTPDRPLNSLRINNATIIRARRKKCVDASRALTLAWGGTAIRRRPRLEHWRAMPRDASGVTAAARGQGDDGRDGDGGGVCGGPRRQVEVTGALVISDLLEERESFFSTAAAAAGTTSGTGQTPAALRTPRCHRRCPAAC